MPMTRNEKLFGFAITIVVVMLYAWAISSMSRTSVEPASTTMLGSDWIDHEAEDTEPGAMSASAPRSPQWPTVRHHFLKGSQPDGWPNAVCFVCGAKRDLNVHHIRPFHMEPELELNPRNLVTLCRNHHFEIGHDPDCEGPEKPGWSKCNPNVLKDGLAERKRLKAKPQ